MTNFRPLCDIGGIKTNRYGIAPLLIVMTAGLCACSTPPGSGSIDGFDLGLKTELHLKDLDRAPIPDGVPLDRVRKLFVIAPPGLDSIRVYSATAVVDKDEDPIPLKVWVTPLEGDGFLVLVLDDDGNVRRSRIWGNEAFDTDPEAAWGNFADQFEYDNSRSVIPPVDALTSHQVDSLWSRLEADTSAAAGTTRLLYEHRLIMYENNYILRRTMAVAHGQNVPPVGWLEEDRAKYRRLEEIGEALRPLIGDSASIKYVGVAREGGEILQRAVEEARASQGDEVRESILNFRRRSCGGCHGIENHDVGKGKLKAALFARLADLGVRRDLYSVGRDVWGVPGERQQAQKIADAVKATLVVAGAK